VIDHPSNRCDGGHVPTEGRPELCHVHMERKAQEAEAAEQLAREKYPEAFNDATLVAPTVMTRDEAKADAEQALRTTPEAVTERLYADEEGVVSLPEEGVTWAPHEGSGPHGGHYGGADNPHETIKCLAAWGLTSNAYLWTAAKYLSRADRKPGEAGVKDLEKAAYYLAAELERRKRA
jgi:hypothetical protein